MRQVQPTKDDLFKGPRILSSSATKSAGKKNSVSAICAPEGPLKAAAALMMSACWRKTDGGGRLLNSKTQLQGKFSYCGYKLF